jgi:hypothetical protein
MARVVRVKMLDHHESRTAIGRHCRKKFSQRIQAAGRGTDPDYCGITILSSHFLKIVCQVLNPRSDLILAFTKIKARLWLYTLLLCRVEAKRVRLKKNCSCQKHDNATRKGGRQTEAGASLDWSLLTHWESLRQLSLENIGKSFFCVDEAKFKRYFFSVRRAEVLPIPSKLYYTIHDVRRQLSFAYS